MPFQANPGQVGTGPSCDCHDLARQGGGSIADGDIVAHGNAAADGDGDPADGAAHGNLVPPTPIPPTATPTQAPTETPMPTPTVQPTATLLPTAAATATPDAASVKVNADIINVRSGPGTAYPVIGRLDGGATQKIVGKSEDGKWWQIATKEGNWLGCGRACDGRRPHAGRGCR